MRSLRRLQRVSESRQRFFGGSEAEGTKTRRARPCKHRSEAARLRVDYLFSLSKMENAKEDNAESRQWIRDNAPALMSLGLQGFALHGKGAVFADPFRKYNPCYVPAWLLPPHQGTKTAVEKYSPESEIVVMLLKNGYHEALCVIRNEAMNYAAERLHNLSSAEKLIAEFAGHLKRQAPKRRAKQIKPSMKRKKEK